MSSVVLSGRILSFLHILRSIPTVYGGLITPRDANIPAPIAFNPDQYWEGIDGSWNSFTLRIGTPTETVRVYPSWKSYQTLVVAAQGCIYVSDLDACGTARGGLFDYGQSSSFDEIGIFNTGFEENLGYIANAVYGRDIVTLGGLGEGGPTLASATVGALAVEDFYLGLFGLNPKPTNWTSVEDSTPSYMTQLKEQNLIPSVSFGYTAGAPYRFTGVLGSLTLGGYDTSRFEESPVEFSFAADNTRDTVVAVQSISTPSQDDSSTTTSLLPTPIYALVDASVPQIWLPVEACQRFEDEFGLTYDNTTDLYLVNSTLHASLLKRGANVTFDLARDVAGGTVSSITLPYSAFDLTAQPPYRGLSNGTTYFPLRRAHNNTQYTLGRAFMQEAYITVDYERARFKVSQCTWVQGAESNLVPISPASSIENSQYSGAGSNTTSTEKSSSLSGGAIGGIAGGVVGGVAVLAGILMWFFWRKHQRNKRATAEAAQASPSPSSRNSIICNSQMVLNEKGTKVFPKAELEGAGIMAPDTTKLLLPGTPTTITDSGTLGGYGTHMSGSTQSTQLVSPLSPGGASEAGGDQVFEMMGDMPEVSQADGRQITEKDLMRRREQEYNGVDPHGSQETQTTPGAEQQMPRRTVRAEEVVIQNQAAERHNPINHDRFSFEAESEAGTTRRTV